LDGTGKVEVRADFHSQWRHDAMLEGVVWRMSLEPEITAVSWHVARNDEQ
jgi:hypothetical protein